jgi:hypothetical protein
MCIIYQMHIEMTVLSNLFVYTCIGGGGGVRNKILLSCPSPNSLTNIFWHFYFLTVKELHNTRDKWVLERNKNSYIVSPVSVYLFVCVFMQLAMMYQVRNLGLEGKTCLDSPARKADLHKPAGLYPCHNQGGNQVRSVYLQVAAVGSRAYFRHHSCYLSYADIWMCTFSHR